MRQSYHWLVVLGLIMVTVMALWASGMFDKKTQQAGPPPAGSQQATFGCGCFWCTEAIFQHVRGVHSVVSGYSGGTVKNPTYQQVCNQNTGHAEVVHSSGDIVPLDRTQRKKQFRSRWAPRTHPKRRAFA